MATTLYAIAKEHGMRPQHLYNLARQGVIKVTKETCSLGEEHVVVDEESLQGYLDRRAERIAKKDAAIEAELETTEATS